jgi:hypothetical protein
MVSENSLNKCIYTIHHSSACEVHIRTHNYVIMSVHPHVSSPEPLTRFWWNLVLEGFTLKFEVQIKLYCSSETTEFTKNEYVSQNISLIKICTSVWNTFWCIENLTKCLQKYLYMYHYVTALYVSLSSRLFVVYVMFTLYCWLIRWNEDLMVIRCF